jgi:hypothetical protein
MSTRSLSSIVAIGAACAVAATATAGIATSIAAPSNGAASTTATTSQGGPGGHRGGGPGGHHGGGPGRGDIHAEIVRADPDGSGFITEVRDSGTVTAVTGSTLTIKQGTASETFGTAKVTLKGTVTVKRNGAAAKVSDIKVGDHVRVMTDGTKTHVHASTAAFDKARAAEHAQHAPRDAAAPSWPKA